MEEAKLLESLLINPWILYFLQNISEEKKPKAEKVLQEIMKSLFLDIPSKNSEHHKHNNHHKHHKHHHYHHHAHSKDSSSHSSSEEINQNKFELLQDLQNSIGSLFSTLGTMGTTENYKAASKSGTGTPSTASSLLTSQISTLEESHEKIDKTSKQSIFSTYPLKIEGHQEPSTSQPEKITKYTKEGVSKNPTIPSREPSESLPEQKSTSSKALPTTYFNLITTSKTEKEIPKTATTQLPITLGQKSTLLVSVSTTLGQPLISLSNNSSQQTTEAVPSKFNNQMGETERLIMNMLTSESVGSLQTSKSTLPTQPPLGSTSPFSSNYPLKTTETLNIERVTSMVTSILSTLSNPSKPPFPTPNFSPLFNGITTKLPLHSSASSSPVISTTLSTPSKPQNSTTSSNFFISKNTVLSSSFTPSHTHDFSSDTQSKNQSAPSQSILQGQTWTKGPDNLTSTAKPSPLSGKELITSTFYTASLAGSTPTIGNQGTSNSNGNGFPSTRTSPSSKLETLKTKGPSASISSQAASSTASSGSSQGSEPLEVPLMTQGKEPLSSPFTSPSLPNSNPTFSDQTTHSDKITLPEETQSSSPQNEITGNPTTLLNSLVTSDKQLPFETTTGIQESTLNQIITDFVTSNSKLSDTSRFSTYSIIGSQFGSNDLAHHSTASSQTTSSHQSTDPESFGPSLPDTTTFYHPTINPAPQSSSNTMGYHTTASSLTTARGKSTITTVASETSDQSENSGLNSSTKINWSTPRQANSHGSSSIPLGIPSSSKLSPIEHLTTITATTKSLLSSLIDWSKNPSIGNTGTLNPGHFPWNISESLKANLTSQLGNIKNQLQNILQTTLATTSTSPTPKMKTSLATTALKILNQKPLSGMAQGSINSGISIPSLSVGSIDESKAGLSISIRNKRNANFVQQPKGTLFMRHNSEKGKKHSFEQLMWGLPDLGFLSGNPKCSVSNKKCSSSMGLFDQWYLHCVCPWLWGKKAPKCPFSHRLSDKVPSANSIYMKNELDLMVLPSMMEQFHNLMSSSTNGPITLSEVHNLIKGFKIFVNGLAKILPEASLLKSFLERIKLEHKVLIVTIANELEGKLITLFPVSCLSQPIIKFQG